MRWELTRGFRNGRCGSLPEGARASTSYGASSHPEIGKWRWRQFPLSRSSRYLGGLELVLARNREGHMPYAENTDRPPHLADEYSLLPAKEMRESHASVALHRDNLRLSSSSWTTFDRLSWQPLP